MELDIFTIVAGGAVVIISVLASLTSVLLRYPRKCKDEDGEGNPGCGISIVIACYDNSCELKNNLPLLLEQDYPNFEVVVVDESSSDDTDDVLKQLKAKYPNLYTTFIPKSSHYLSRRKLAMTVGVKASRNEWIVFVDVAGKPSDNLWLARLARQCRDDKDMVMGYANYDEAAKPYYRYRQLVASVRNLRKAQTSVAYAAGGNTIAIRRSMFMAGNGFVKDLKYLRGEYDFLVNGYAQAGRVGVALDAVMIKDSPSYRSWLNESLFYIETRRHLARSKMWRLPFVADTLMLHLAFLLDLAMIVLASLTGNWIVLGFSILGLMSLFALRTLFVERTAKSMGEKFPLMLIPLMELRMVWTNALLLLQHKVSDKYDFIRK